MANQIRNNGNNKPIFTLASKQMMRCEANTASFSHKNLVYIFLTLARALARSFSILTLSSLLYSFFFVFLPVSVSTGSPLPVKTFNKPFIINDAQ